MRSTEKNERKLYYMEGQVKKKVIFFMRWLFENFNLVKNYWENSLIIQINVMRGKSIGAF